MKTKSFNQLPEDERTKIMLSVALDFTLDAIKRDFHMKLQSGASIEELQDLVDSLDIIFTGFKDRHVFDDSDTCKPSDTTCYEHTEEE